MIAVNPALVDKFQEDGENLQTAQFLQFLQQYRQYGTEPNLVLILTASMQACKHGIRNAAKVLIWHLEVLVVGDGAQSGEWAYPIISHTRLCNMEVDGFLLRL